MIDYSLYLVTDDPSRYRGNWLEQVMAAVEGGVTAVQYRDTESSPDGRYARAKMLQDALRVWQVPLIVNNDVELALAVGAQGVHVGQRDLNPAAVRQLAGDRLEIGYSVTTLAQLKAALRDYAPLIACLGMGPVFDARGTKRDAAQPIGLETLAELTAAAGKANHCAIGGITVENAPAVLAAGAKGLAVVSAFSKAEDPTAVARAFNLLLRRMPE